MPQNFAEQNLYHACQTLFGPRFKFSRQSLEELECTGLKKAFRKKAFETHPDMIFGRVEMNGGLSARKFRVVHQAYENLTNYLQAREKGFDLKPFSSLATSAQYRYSSPGVDGLYRGPFPRRSLLFGHFLYYSGVANWNTIGKALIWQRLKLPFIGELALTLGWLTREELIRIIRQSSRKDFFGLTAIKLGLLDKKQLQELISLQDRKKKKIGGYFLEKNILPLERLEELVAKSRSHNELF